MVRWYESHDKDTSAEWDKLIEAFALRWRAVSEWIQIRGREEGSGACDDTRETPIASISLDLTAYYDRTLCLQFAPRFDVGQLS